MLGPRYLPLGMLAQIGHHEDASTKWQVSGAIAFASHRSTAVGGAAAAMPLWPLWIEMLAVPAPRFAYVARRAAVLHRPGAFAGARMCSTGAAAEPLFSVLQVGLARAAEREQRKRASLEKEASAATKAEGLGRWGTLVTSNLYRIPADATSAVVEDWEQGGKEVTLTFDAKIGSPRLEAEKAFTAARKLRRGSAVVADLLEESMRTTASLGEWQARPEPGCTQCAPGARLHTVRPRAAPSGQ